MAVIRLRSFVLASVAVLATGLAASAGPVAAKPAAAHLTPSQQARELGHRVPVPALTTTAGQAFAEPDGTFTFEQHAVPVRVRRGAGWVRLDTALRSAADGVVPVAVPVPLRFSPGGTGPVITYGDTSQRIELRWPGRLPAPSVSGDTATYRNALPGVDLRLTARAQGFAEVLVVRDRQAAGRVARVTLGVRTHGLTLRVNADQSLDAVDSAGRQVFSSPAPRMWDAGTRQATGRVELAAGSLTVIPDQAMLADPATVYPVSVDPDFHAGQTGWAEVIAQHPTQSYWGGDGDSGAKVGYSDWSSPTVTYRSYFQYDSSFLLGRNILSAEFNAYENYSPSCSARSVEMWQTGQVGSNLTWNNQPTHFVIDSANAAHGYDGSCPGSSIGFDATRLVQDRVSGDHSATVTVMLKAGSETDRYGWKKFNTNPSLIVHYNSFPSAPSGQSAGFSGHPGEWACAAQPNEPYIATTTPTLYATVSDPDGGTLAAHFQWSVRGGGVVGEATTAAQASGTRFSVPIPAGAFADGAKISWRVQGWDGTNYGGWSPSCDLTVDQTAPDRAPTVSSSVYPENGWGGSAGVTGAFTFGANGVADVASYQFGLIDPPTRTVVASQLGGGATAGVTPAEFGPQHLYVRSRDRAGNLGPVYVYVFYAFQGAGPVGQWHLDGFGLDTLAVDAAGRDHDGTTTALPSTAYWLPGRVGNALHLDGGSGAVSTAGGQAVHTDASFSVAAWVRLDRADGVWHTAVSEDATRSSGFYLQYLGDTHEWGFALPPSDTDSFTPDRLVATAPVRTGVWTHLVGTYDSGSGAIRLYVNGQLVASGTHAHPWDATGAVQIGRAKYAGTPADYWPGSVDEVQVFQRVLSGGEVHDLATAPAREEGFYGLDEGGGTLAGDLSGNYRTATLSGGASWTAGPVGGGALQLDGQAGEADTIFPAVSTDASFTVSALVRLDSVNGTWQYAVSQDGTHASGFVLGYRADTRRWTFGVIASDVDNPAAAQVNSLSAPSQGEWTALAGVYDVAAQEVRIYVNGVEEGHQPVTTPIAGVVGDLVLGRARQGGAKVNFWTGALDDVHVYTGVRSGDQIRDEFVQPVAAPYDPYPRQLTRWYGVSGHWITTGPGPADDQLEGSLGLTAPPGTAGTMMLYSCRFNGMQFVSGQSDCEGAGPLIGPIGLSYVSPPAGLPSVAIYRCYVPSNGDHFVSGDPACEGQHVDGPLGYLLAYGVLERYASTGVPVDRWAGLGIVSAAYSGSVPDEYQPDAGLGLISLTLHPDGAVLYNCRAGDDGFESTAADCGGGAGVRNLGATGTIWTSPPADHPSGAVYSCQAAGTGDRFESLDAACEGQQVLGVLGYTLTGSDL